MKEDNMYGNVQAQAEILEILILHEKPIDVHVIMASGGTRLAEIMGKPKNLSQSIGQVLKHLRSRGYVDKKGSQWLITNKGGDYHEQLTSEDKQAPETQSRPPIPESKPKSRPEPEVLTGSPVQSFYHIEEKPAKLPPNFTFVGVPLEIYWAPERYDAGMAFVMLEGSNFWVPLTLDDAGRICVDNEPADWQGHYEIRVVNQLKVIFPNEDGQFWERITKVPPGYIVSVAGQSALWFRRQQEDKE